MIDKMIASYLASGKRLQIPHFGAFLHKEGDGAVVFVPFLKKDDGVLTGLLCREYGLDEAEVHAMIAEYVEQVSHSIAQRGRYTIEGVGELTADANGTLFLDVATASVIAASSPPPATSSTSVSATQTVSPAAASVTLPASTPSIPTPGNPSAPTAPSSPPAQAATRVPAREMHQSPTAPKIPVPFSTLDEAPRAGARQPAAAPIGTPEQQASPESKQPLSGALPPRFSQQFSPSAPTRPQAATQPIAQLEARPTSPAGTPTVSSAQPTPASSIGGQAAVPPRPATPGGINRPPATPASDIPRRPIPPRPPQKAPSAKSDRFLVIAILAAIVALASIIYGVIASSDGPMLDLKLPSREVPVDSAVVSVPDPDQ